jgi:uncharacterized protein YaiI (UPF0178 family)
LRKKDEIGRDVLREIEPAFVADRVEARTLAVTRRRVVAKGGLALNPRGELYSDDNIGGRLAMRDLIDELRGAGLVTGGPSGYSPKDRQAFANHLDKWLSKRR